jgi:hypothetical protein
MFFAATHVYLTCFLLPHMYTAHDFAATHVHHFTATLVKQFWWIQAVVIRAIIHFWPNCATAWNVFNNTLIQGFTWFGKWSLDQISLDIFSWSKFSVKLGVWAKLFIFIFCQLIKFHLIFSVDRNFLKA